MNRWVDWRPLADMSQTALAQTQGLEPCDVSPVFMEKVSMAGANVLKRGHNIEMNEASKGPLLLKTTNKPGRQGRGVCLKLMMENSF